MVQQRVPASIQQDFRKEFLSTLSLLGKTRKIRLSCKSFESDKWQIAYAAGCNFADHAAILIRALGGMAGEW